MNKDIEKAFANLRSKLIKENCKLALHGKSLIVVNDKDHCWDNTFISIDTELQNRVQFDFPIY